MKDFAFAQAPTSGLPRQKRVTYAVAALIHILLFAVVMHLRSHPVRVASAGSPYGSMVAYVPGPIGGAPATSTPKPVAPKKPAMATKTVRASDAEAAAATKAVGAVGAGQGTGPVRLGSGGSLTLV